MTAYFKVTSGPVHKVITDFYEKLQANRAGMRAWIMENKKSLPRVVGHRGRALIFKDRAKPDIKLWRELPNGRGWYPRKNTLAGRAIMKDLEAIPDDPGHMSLLFGLSALPGAGKDIMKVNQTRLPGLKIEPMKGKANKGQLNIKLAIDPYWLPTDRTGLEEIKGSEYGKEPS